MSQTTLSATVGERVDPAQRSPGLALAIIVTGQLMLILDATVMNVALPRIQSALGFTPTGLAWVMSAYTLAFGGLLLLGGRVGDLFGRRATFIAGVSLFTLASLLGALATSPGWLLAARALQGVAAAAAGPSTIALVVTTFTQPAARVRALALLSAVSGGGFAIGLLVGGVLTEIASWRWVLLINVPFGLAAALLAVRFVPRPPRTPARLDLPGALTASTGVAAVVYGLLRVATAGWSDGWTWAFLAGGVALIAAFVRIEARTRQPLLPLRLFADRDRAIAYASFFIGPAAMMSTFFFLTQFLQDVRGMGALATGFAFLPMAATMFTMSRLVPRLLPRFGPRPLAVTGAALLVAGLLLLSRLGPQSAYWPGIAVPMVVLGLGGGLGFVPLTPVVMARVAPADAGAAGGALQTAQQLGASLGLAVLVTVFSSAAGTTAPPAGLVNGMTAAFTVAAGIAAVALLLATTFRRSR